MMPVAPANTRTITKDYNILGYKLPKGVNIVIVINKIFVYYNVKIDIALINT